MRVWIREEGVSEGGDSGGGGNGDRNEGRVCGGGDWE